MEVPPCSDAPVEPPVRRDSMPQHASGDGDPFLSPSPSSSATIIGEPSNQDTFRRPNEERGDNTGAAVCERDSSQSGAGRARAGNGSIDPEDASNLPSPSSAGVSAAIHDTSCASRCQRLLTRSSRSGSRSCSSLVIPSPWLLGGSVLRKASKQVVLRGADLIRGLCKAHGPQLSQSFGNFDQLVGLGWLLADMVIGCLVSRADAFSIGKKAGKLAPGFKKEFEAPRMRAGKRKFSSEEERARAFSAADAEAAAIRLEPVELPFPAVRAARAQAAALKRKRVEPDQPAPAPMRSLVPIERWQTHDSLGMEFCSVHITMLADYIPMYRRSLHDSSVVVAEVAQELEEARLAERRAESGVVEAQLARDRQAKRPEPLRPPWMLDASDEEWLAAKQKKHGWRS